MAVVDVSWMFDDAGALSDDGRLACACAYAAFAFIILRVVKRWLIRAFPSNVAVFVPYDATGKNRGDVVVVALRVRAHVRERSWSSARTGPSPR